MVAAAAAAVDDNYYNFPHLQLIPLLHVMNLNWVHLTLVIMHHKNLPHNVVAVAAVVAYPSYY